MAKKTVKCERWLTCILNEVLPKPKQTSAERTLLENRSINVVDSSCVKQEGINGANIRIHVCYSLFGRHITETLVTDQHTAESFKPFDIMRGDIYMADAGYGKGKNLEYIVANGADALLRVTPNHITLARDPHGKEPIDMATELATNDDIVELYCHVRTENKKYIPTRIIASRLPADKAAEAVKRKKRSAQKHQSTIRPQTLVYANWVILMTSLDATCAAEKILQIYRLRWQIELLFKRIKQFFKITRVRAATVRHSKVLILLWLIAWALTERETVAAETFLLSKQADMHRYSAWTMTGFYFNLLKAAIFSLLSCFDFVDLLRSYKQLQNHKTTRNSQLSRLILA